MATSNAPKYKSGQTIVIRTSTPDTLAIGIVKSYGIVQSAIEEGEVTNLVVYDIEIVGLSKSGYIYESDILGRLVEAELNQ